MNTKPLLLIVETSNHNGYNYERDALALILRQSVGIDVLVIDSYSDLKKKSPRLKQAQDLGYLIGAIVAKDDYDLANVADYLQKETSSTLPLIFVESIHEYEDPDKEIVAGLLNHRDSKLQDWAKDLVNTWQSNGRADHLPLVDKDYQSQLNKINSLTGEEKSQLCDRLLSQSQEGASFGQNVKGFAIHTTTLEWQISGGRGCHKRCVDILSYRLQTIDFKYPGIIKQVDDGMIIFGLVFNNPPDGFSFPIIILYDWDTDLGCDISNVLDLIAREHRWLPILTSQFDNS